MVFKQMYNKITATIIEIIGIIVFIISITRGDDFEGMLFGFILIILGIVWYNVYLIGLIQEDLETLFKKIKLRGKRK